MCHCKLNFAAFVASHSMRRSRLGDRRAPRNSLPISTPWACKWSGLVRIFLCLATLSCCSKESLAFRVFTGAELFGTGISRWDAAPHFVDGEERSLAGGLRYSLEGGSYEAFRDMIHWEETPSVQEFQSAVEQAFNDWMAVDPGSGLGTDLQFVPDFDTPVFLEPLPPTFDDLFQLNRGAEIDLFVDSRVNKDLQIAGHVDPNTTTLTLTSGVENYPGGSFSGWDIVFSEHSVYANADSFKTLLGFGIGITIGLADADTNSADLPLISQFYDDNFDATSDATALETLTNSFAHLIDPNDPDNSPGLMLFEPCIGPSGCISRPGLDSPGVTINQEASPGELRLGPQNDDYAGRQFLYPFVSELQTLTGDYNGSGLVEQGDLDLVLLTWGKDDIPAEWISNPPTGPVDQQELDAVLLNWGSGAPLDAGSVPEPRGVLIAIVTLVVIVGWTLGSPHKRKHFCRMNG